MDEVWWFANSRYPDMALSARLAIAESVERELLQEARVTLVRGPWPEPRHEREAVPLAEGDAVLRNWPHGSCRQAN